MVGKIEIIYSEEFIVFLDELTKTLYDLGYFGFVEDAEFYVEKIYDFISANIDAPILVIKAKRNWKNKKKKAEKEPILAI